MSGKFNITSRQAKGLYELIKFLHDTLLDNNIPYWVTGGTLLGAVRHRGMIPWDDDGDICIMKKDVGKLNKLRSYFEKNGYSLDDEEDGVIFMEKTSGSLGMDIFVMDRIGGIITFADKGWRTAENGGIRCFFYYKYVFPLLPMRFGNFWVMTPNNPVDHLNSCYGTDWNSDSQRLYDHREGKWINSKKKRMLPTDYSTIPAPKSTCDPEAPEVPCTKSISIRHGAWDDISNKELKFLAKALEIKGRSNMSRKALIKAVSEATK